MVRLRRALVALLVVTLLLSTAAHGASACATAVLRDWSDDGRVAPKYSLPCYEDAIDALPADLRDYTNAEDVITRALSSAVRTRGPSQQSVNGARVEQAGGVPLLLVGLAGTALVVVSAGGVGYAIRRRRVLQGPDELSS